jgi:hypothetical protein
VGGSVLRVVAPAGNYFAGPGAQEVAFFSRVAASGSNPGYLAFVQEVGTDPNGQLFGQVLSSTPDQTVLIVSNGYGTPNQVLEYQFSNGELASTNTQNSNRKTNLSTNRNTSLTFSPPYCRAVPARWWIDFHCNGDRPLLFRQVILPIDIFLPVFSTFDSSMLLTTAYCRLYRVRLLDSARLCH